MTPVELQERMLQTANLELMYRPGEDLVVQVDRPELQVEDRPVPTEEMFRWELPEPVHQDPEELDPIPVVNYMPVAVVPAVEESHLLTPLVTVDLPQHLF